MAASLLLAEVTASGAPLGTRPRRAAVAHSRGSQQGVERLNAAGHSAEEGGGRRCRSSRGRGSRDDRFWKAGGRSPKITGRGSLPTCLCPAVGSMPISEHVAALPGSSCHSTRTPRPWSAPWCASATRSRREPSRPPLPGQIITNADRLSTGKPLVSLCPAERLPPTPQATGGAPGLWGVSRVHRSGTAYARGHHNESSW
jgi:hypothetical protein